MNNNTKVCDTCGEIKIANVDFSIRREKGTEYIRNTCKKCRCHKEKQRREDNKTRDFNLHICSKCKQSKHADQYDIIVKRNGEKKSAKCKECRKDFLDYQKNWRSQNKSHVRVNYTMNKKSILQKCMEYRNRNKHKIKLFKHIYYQKRENKLRKNMNITLRRKRDYLFRLLCNMRSRIRTLLKGSKKDCFDNLTGCTRMELVKWLEYQFTSDFSWDNYGKVWHVDHVIPLAFFNLACYKEQKLALNWSNLRPLKAIENMSKNAFIIENVITEHMRVIQEFKSLNTGYQTNIETCWWQRVELWYGKNPKVNENFRSFLERAIRSEDPQSSTAPKKYKAKLKTG
jgi:hypothetical protein